MYNMFKFHPGETFVLNFIIPFSKWDVSTVVLSFRNRDRVAYEAMASSFKVENTEEEEAEGIYKLRVGFLFSQSDSLMFDENENYTMQLNVFGPNGSRATSKDMGAKTLSQQITEPGFSTEPLEFAVPNRTISYNRLTDRPRINEITLQGNRVLPEKRISEEQIDETLSSREHDTGDQSEFDNIKVITSEPILSSDIDALFS